MIMTSKIKILIGILIVGISLIGGWLVLNQKQAPIEEFCTSNVLENCYGKKVKVVGTFEALKGCNAGIIVSPEKGETIFLPEFTGKCEVIKQYEGKKVELVGTIEKHVCPPATQCWGKMVIKSIDSIKILEAQTKIIKEVTITTDKTEYEEEETVKIILRNNLSKSIWYLNGHKLCSDINKGYRIYQFLAEEWIDVTPPMDCPAIEEAGLPIFKELSSNDSVVFTWDLKILDKVKGSIEAPPGKYKFLMFYKEDEKTEKLKEVYSNEFAIKERREASDEYKIYLSSRQFIPEPGISDTLKSILRNTSFKRIHVLLQFYHIPNKDERSELSNLNVTLCSYVHNNAYFASIPTKYLTDIYNLSFVRWIGEILPEDKISRYIRNGTIGDWAINPNGTVNLIVEFFKDVSLDDAERIIERYGGVTNSRIRSINALVVTIPQDAIHELANEDCVQWIEGVPPPPIAEPYDITDITEAEK